MDLTIRVSGQAVAKGQVPKKTSIAFRTDAFHVGQNSYSPVSPVYFDRAPFKFSGKKIVSRLVRDTHHGCPEEQS